MTRLSNDHPVAGFDLARLRPENSQYHQLLVSECFTPGLETVVTNGATTLTYVIKTNQLQHYGWIWR